VPAGERTEELETLLREGSVITRAFAGEGVRISSGSAEDIDRVEAALAASPSGSDLSVRKETTV
jgi:histidinol-phosphate aminotransferase